MIRHFLDKTRRSLKSPKYAVNWANGLWIFSGIFIHCGNQALEFEENAYDVTLYPENIQTMYHTLEYLGLGILGVSSALRTIWGRNAGMVKMTNVADAVAYSLLATKYAMVHDYARATSAGFGMLGSTLCAIDLEKTKKAQSSRQDDRTENNKALENGGRILMAGNLTSIAFAIAQQQWFLLIGLGASLAGTYKYSTAELEFKSKQNPCDAHKPPELKSYTP